jgi:hypothetical protein
MPRGNIGRCNVLDRHGFEALPFRFFEERRRQRPGRAFNFARLRSRARNHKKFSARRDERSECRKGIRQKCGRERLQRVAFMDEIKIAAPVIRQGEEIALDIPNLRGRKPQLRPLDRLVHDIERRDVCARGRKTFGIVAKAAPDIENF